MPAKIKICTGGDCVSLGGSHLVRDLEDLADGQCVVMESSCFGKCGKGPNVEVTLNGPPQLIHRVNKFSKACETLEDAGFGIDSMTKKSGKEKWSIRREEDPAKRKEKLAVAFKTVGGESNVQYPALLSSLLVMRSKETLKVSPVSATKDAKRASELAPGYPQALLTYANALEAISYSADGMKALQQLLDLGHEGTNKTQIKKLMQRMERKVEVESAKASRPSLEDFLKAAPKAKAKAKGTGKAKPKAKAEAPVEKGPTPEELEAMRLKESQELEEKRVQELMDNPPDWFDWRIDNIKTMSHDCVEIRLTCPDAVVPMAQWSKAYDTLAATWHIDFKKELADPNAKPLIRAYTPISDIEAFKKGQLDIMIKIYPNGLMTQHVASLVVGDTISVSGPITTVDPTEYEAGVTLVAGGSAVTIAYQLCFEVLAMNPNAMVTLFLCNRQAGDALYHEKFEVLLEDFSLFSLTHCLSSGQVPDEKPGSAKANWWGGRISGFLLGAVRNDLKIVLSGPGGLLYTSRKLLLELGHSMDNILPLDPIEEPPEAPQVEAPAAVALEEPESKPAEPVKGVTFVTPHPLPQPAEQVKQQTGFFMGLFCCRVPQVAADDPQSEFPADAR